MTNKATPTRCAWPGADPLYIAYHDREWGVPVRDSRDLWEYLSLEAFQAGLSWITVLRKREHFRAAFAAFDPDTVARFGERDVKRLLGDAGIIRSRAKIVATIGNARAYLELRERGVDFAQWIWAFADDAPIQNDRARAGDVPAVTPVALEMSKALKSKGFKFVGPTIVYAFMQAVGVVNDHVTSCFRHRQVKRLGRRGT
ncbi:MAG TPA: DNA-3-methyladenine glycosylase I [Steroidobacteraceae bacterium]|nr:DNA-3-methyladenine glycosylase I [Steroidobacteraceae bacterium]